MADENFALGFNPSGLEADQGPTANSPMEKKLLQLSSVELEYLQQLIRNNPKTDIVEVINLEKKTLVPVHNTASAKVNEVEGRKKTSSEVCAAGLKCKISLGCTAPRTHRCPGPFQDFSFCNKPIHAICGVAIPQHRINKETNNTGMHTRWCFGCALKVEKLCYEPNRLVAKLNPKNPYNTTSSKTQLSFRSRSTESEGIKQADKQLPPLSKKECSKISSTPTEGNRKFSNILIKYDFI